MPIFEYECLECGHQFEYLVRSASPSVECPACAQHNLKQLVSLCGVSSEASRAANLSAAHKVAASRRQDRQRSEHHEHHDHFGDSSTTK